HRFEVGCGAAWTSGSRLVVLRGAQRNRRSSNYTACAPEDVTQIINEQDACGSTAKLAVLQSYQQFAGFSYSCSPEFHHLFVFTLIPTAVITILQVITQRLGVELTRIVEINHWLILIGHGYLRQSRP